MSQSVPDWHKPIGIGLAVISALFIGSSFVVKKKGLIDTNSLGRAKDKGHAYLKSYLWWTGMTLMLVGEIFNFAAYAFAPAVLITPLGALSVVVSAFLSSIVLKERLNFAGKIGCAQCVIGAIIIVLHTPESAQTNTIPAFLALVIRPAFLVFAILCFCVVAGLVVYAAPRHGQQWPLIYISICSIIGAFVVISTQGLGSAIVYSAANPNDNQLLLYQSYAVLAFIICGGVIQINYLNKALNLFSTAIVRYVNYFQRYSPIYYVVFTTFTLIASGILVGGGFDTANAVNFATLCFGFLVIVGGVALLFEYSLKLSRIEALAKLEAASRSDGTSSDDISQSSKQSFSLVERPRRNDDAIEVLVK